ncbi:GTPase-activating protein gyp10 [Cladobotryum mycophilum]|uniref:GTPase-activating protein gyp10 n=1 Tax=Cladobotryum mycophilum TaxID=491253 RepID=A0ABR0T195_9HYPO
MDSEKELIEATGNYGGLDVEFKTVDDTGPSSAITQKTSDILEACKWRDATRLRSLAESDGGFLSDTLRQTAWPILLGLPSPTLDEKNSEAHPATEDYTASDGNWRDFPRHRDEDQVQLDVNRSFIYYPNDQSDAEIDKRKQELSRLITEVLRRNPYLCYFQGYHDICQVFLLVLQPETRARMVARLSVLRIRDFMLPSLGPTTAQLRLLPDVLAQADPELREHIAGIEPYYALAGTLTMYSHNIEGYHDIARIFDVILAHEPVFSIYMFAQIVIDRRDEILEIDEHDMLQVILGRVPSRMDLDALIKKAVDLFERHPQKLYDIGTLEDGHRYFEKQASEVHWQELRDRMKMMVWAYRRSAGVIGMAVAVGVIAVCVRRNPTTLQSILNFFSKW